jgi:hypothetical protein
MILDEKVRFETELSVDEAVRALAHHVRSPLENWHPEGLRGSVTRDRVVIGRRRGPGAMGRWFGFRGQVVGGQRTALEGKMGLGRCPMLFLAAWLGTVLVVWVAMLVLRISGRLVPGRENEATWVHVIRGARKDAAYIKAQVEEILRGCA